MSDEYFSDRELGKEKLDSEKITDNVYDGIVAVFNDFIKCFAEKFPIYCSDYNNVVCGVNKELLYASIKSEIPELETPIKLIENIRGSLGWGDPYYDKYTVLDFVEYCYKKISDYNEEEYHDYFKHCHLTFPNTKNCKKEFKNRINKIFERNGLVFYLDEDGLIKRHLPLELGGLVDNMVVKTSDDRLNELINIAIKDIKLPKKKNRIIALEKIWDAFERLKTFYGEDKKESAEKLVEKISDGTEGLEEEIKKEFFTLTDIGNNYQIRHFESGKTKIKSLEHIDYLFYRMISLINLSLKKINL
ncbi:MAG: hypothetical protein FXF47_08480 [Candidatus Mcinerneyibacterium aminivorans]|uniref:HEPN AbiJ-N-terminal domain-containing protein n=1 Tax=Candidatus Mcinerneyibacterium aminivorans TaxID=2703815 RepID=A0A5D0MGH4_9BACT|nr:MAG: hypothetical protein FXF47_08480 [Candidatus Mcinerneyibacterium aminivorans]